LRQTIEGAVLAKLHPRTIISVTVQVISLCNRSGPYIETSGGGWHALELDPFGLNSTTGICRNWQDRICKNCSMGAIENELHMVFECPLFAPSRLKYSKLFAAAQDLSSVCQSPLAARFTHDCMHAENVAED